MTVWTVLQVAFFVGILAGIAAGCWTYMESVTGAAQTGLLVAAAAQGILLYATYGPGGILVPRWAVLMAAEGVALGSIAGSIMHLYWRRFMRRRGKVYKQLAR